MASMQDSIAHFNELIKKPDWFEENEGLYAAFNCGAFLGTRKTTTEFFVEHDNGNAHLPDFIGQISKENQEKALNIKPSL